MIEAVRQEKNGSQRLVELQNYNIHVTVLNLRHGSSKNFGDLSESWHRSFKNNLHSQNEFLTAVD